MSTSQSGSHGNSVTSFTILSLIGLLPITMMTELRGGSANFWLLLTVSLIACFSRSGGFSATIALFRPYRSLFLALLMFPTSAILAMIWSQSWLGPDTERALRVFFGMLGILGALLGIKKSWLRQSVWGVFAGVAGGAGSMIWMTWPHFRRPDMDQYTTVGYSNILLILIVIVLFSLGWRLTRLYRAEQALKLTVALVGLCGLAIAETRTNWVAIPFFLTIGLYLAKSNFTLKQFFILFLSVIALITVIFFARPLLLDRFQLGMKEIVECPKSQYLAENSVCTRIQLWNASWHMFKVNPLLGNGDSSRFVPELEKLYEKGIITESTKNDFGEPHNDLFLALANYGIFGLITYLLLYFVPGWFFLKKLSNYTQREERVAAAMGLAVCLGFLVFGITETMFRSMRMLSFYVVLVAWLLALLKTENR